MKNSHHVRLAQYKKGFASIIIALIVAVVLGGGYLIYKNIKVEAPATTTFSVSGNILSVVSDGKVVQTVSSLDKSKQGALAFGGSDPLAVPSFITDKDMNFDGHSDVGALSGTGYGGINYFYDFYIFNPITQRQEKNDVLSGVGSNIRLDPVKKQVISTYKSGPGYVTDTYQWDGSTFIKSGPVSITQSVTAQQNSSIAQGTDTACAPYINNTTDNSPKITTKNGLSTYTNSDYGFQIAYPDSLQASSSFVGAYSLSRDWRQNSHCSFYDYNHEDAAYESYVLLGQQIVSVVFDNATYTPPEYPNSTSTLEVEVRIGASNDATEVAHCLDTDAEVVSTSTVTINGVAFHKYNYKRTELSNRTTFSSYRTIHNNTCFAIEPAFSWVAYDPTVLISKDQPIVDSVVNSFKFTK